jgi:hypothetical protein
MSDSTRLNPLEPRELDRLMAILNRRCNVSTLQGLSDEKTSSETIKRYAQVRGAWLAPPDSISDLLGFHVIVEDDSGFRLSVLVTRIEIGIEDEARPGGTANHPESDDDGPGQHSGPGPENDNQSNNSTEHEPTRSVEAALFFPRNGSVGVWIGQDLQLIVDPMTGRIALGCTAQSRLEIAIDKIQHNPGHHDSPAFYSAALRVNDEHIGTVIYSSDGLFESFHGDEAGDAVYKKTNDWLLSHHPGATSPEGDDVPMSLGVQCSCLLRDFYIGMEMRRAMEHEVLFYDPDSRQILSGEWGTIDIAQACQGVREDYPRAIIFNTMDLGFTVMAIHEYSSSIHPC